MHSILPAGRISTSHPIQSPLPATQHAARGDLALTQLTSTCRSVCLQRPQQPFVAGQQHIAACSRGSRLLCAAQAGPADRRLMVKLSLAQGSGSLDLSEFELDSVPEEVCDLTQLEELTLAGNMLTQLPDRIGNLTHLQKLQLSGNRLTQLPDSISSLSRLEGLWVHGNLLTSLPASIGDLSSLRAFSAVGNQLTSIPESIGSLQSLTSLELAANRLKTLPESVGRLGHLEKLQLHGNQLRELPQSISGLTSLKSLSLQGNALHCLPDGITCLQALEELLAADNKLESLPDGLFQALRNLRTVLLYGNMLKGLPAEPFLSSNLKELWAEANPLESSAVHSILQQAARIDDRRVAFGLDSKQLLGTSAAQKADAGQHLRPGDIAGVGHGYFKLAQGREGDVISADGVKGDRALAVAFGSAPGVPNWGGLLSRVRKAAQDSAHDCFDILYVVDPARSWYSDAVGAALLRRLQSWNPMLLGPPAMVDLFHVGGDEGFQYWWDRLAAVTGRYSRVLMLGDSMGATAALLFSPLATAVHAFTPQVDLTTASLRPGRDSAWLGALTQRVMANVSASEARITVHSSTWLHDLDQAKLLPADKVQLKVYSVSTHRLARYLDSTEQLLPIVRGTLLQEMGFSSGHIRLHNLV